ncbi:MAG: EF-P lysine aminoacylase EpmA [Chromatiales bacterium]|jgi:lysyl-tRNA synthetase class 2
MRDLLLARAQLLERIRQYFAETGVLEVSTPVLSFCANTDPAIESFATAYRAAGASQDAQPMYLHTSPEFFMKRLLCAGSGSIYQIAPVFRNGEAGRLHNPEFSLLEWYRLDFDQHALMQDVQQLLMSLLPQPVEVDRFSYQELFERHLGINPHLAELGELHALAESQHISVTSHIELSKEDWLELLFNQVIEAQFDQQRLTFVYDYPASQASLARIRDDDEAPVAERFELYFQGVELANGFHELQHADEQLLRFQQDNRKRQQRGQQALPIDMQLIAALRGGLPDCSGVALGLDRLLMILLGESQLDEVLAFPLNEV